MLNDAKNFQKMYIAYGYTDLRLGIDGLAGIVKQYFSLNPFTPNILFLLCGRKYDRIKGLLWEEDGFLPYKRLENGRFQWPRTESEVLSITTDQYTWLMQGLSLEQMKII